MNELPRFPEFEVEGVAFSKVLLGHNPFLSGSYMSKARSREYRERFESPKEIQKVIEAAIEAGARGMMLGCRGGKDGPLLTAFKDAAKSTGILIPTFVIVSRDFEEQIDLMHEVNCKVAHIHGQITDALYIKSENSFQPEFAETLAKIREAGFIPGMSTHNAGETIPAAKPFDVSVIVTPINKIMWRMCPCEEMVLTAIRKTAKKIVAMKPLAMGRIAPQEGMDYVCRLSDVDGIVVGIGTAYEAEETFGAAADTLRRIQDVHETATEVAVT